MNVRRTATAALGCLALGAPVPADAGSTFRLTADRLAFFLDGLLVVGRSGARYEAGALHGAADAVAADLRRDRVVLAGHAWLERDGRRIEADAIAIDVDAGRVDTLDLTTGVARTDAGLHAARATPAEPQRFAFPDVDDRRAYIRAKTAVVTAHASARFSPASFPTSVGSVPVPSYLYDYALGSGWGAQSLPGATFDQPYHLAGTTHALTSVHARYIDGVGPALAVDQHLVANDDAYLVASVDAVNRPNRTVGLTAYRRAGIATFTLDATNAYGFTLGRVSTAVPLRSGGARVDYAAWSSGGSSLDLTLRGADRPLLAGATWRPQADLGFDAQRGGVLTVLPDRAAYATVWRKDLGLSISSPIVAGPLGTRIGGTVQGTRRWYAFPHTRDLLTTNATATRTFTHALSAALTYAAAWGADDFHGRQHVFYAPPSPRYLAPDGTPWPGFAAYDGFSSARGLALDITDAPVPDVSLRLSLRTASDFPQFHGYGRPPMEVRFDARFRPLPNVGIAIGRAYDFAWGGTRWQPRWTFAILP